MSARPTVPPPQASCDFDRSNFFIVRSWHSRELTNHCPLVCVVFEVLHDLTERDLEKGQALENHNRPLKDDRDASADDEPDISSISDPGQSGAAQCPGTAAHLASTRASGSAPDTTSPTAQNEKRGVNQKKEYNEIVARIKDTFQSRPSLRRLESVAGGSSARTSSSSERGKRKTSIIPFAGEF